MKRYRIRKLTPTEALRPLTTDPWDNAILNEYEEQKA